MFARTKRLTLRPAWPEDAPALAAAIGHEAVVRNLVRAPWPYGLADAEAFLALSRASETPEFVITAMDGGSPALVGGIGLHRHGDALELGYWLTPPAWGRGYATEAARAVVAIARHSLGAARLHASWFVDNPASGRVLAKLGFRETGHRVMHSRARACHVEAVTVAVDLIEPRSLPLPIAA